MTTVANTLEVGRAEEGAAAEIAAPAGAKKPRRTVLVLGALGVVAAAAVSGWYLQHRGLESTDDAQIVAT